MLNSLKFTLVIGVFLLHGSSRAKGQIAPSFDERDAMRTLFGTYDEKTNSANATLPNDHLADLTGSQFQPGDKLIVQPFWHRIYRTDGTAKAVLLTDSVPNDPSWTPIVSGDQPFSCHACTPLIGVTVFTWSEGKWKPALSRLAVTRGGAWGHPPSPIRLLKVGPDRMAVEIEDDYEGGGTTTTNLLIIPLEDRISSVLLIRTGEDDSGGCERRQPADEPACYRYKKTLRFKSGPNADYYDIYTSLRGTDYNEGASPGVHRVSGREVFRFANGVYTNVVKESSSPEGNRR
jgi:hypothetical protein